MPTLALQVRTKDDAHGMPRRGWLILDSETGEIKTFVYAGRKGNRALTERGYLDAVITKFTVDLSVKEFQFWREVEKKR